MKIRYEVKIIGLWILAFLLIALGCVVWSNATLPLVLIGGVCVLASERIIDQHEI